MDPQTKEERQKFSWVWTTLALILAYTSAFLFDSTLRRFRDYAGASFNFRPGLILNLIFPFLIVGIILALAWLSLVYTSPNWIIAALYAVSGLLLVGWYPAFFAGIGFPLWIRDTFIARFILALLDFGFPSSLYLIGSGSIFIGLAAFWRVRKQVRDPVEGS